MNKQDILNALLLKEQRYLERWDSAFVIENKFYKEVTFPLIENVAEEMAIDLRNRGRNKPLNETYIIVAGYADSVFEDELDKEEIDGFFNIYRGMWLTQAIKFKKANDGERYYISMAKYINTYLSKEIYFYHLEGEDGSKKGLDNRLRIEVNKVIDLAPTEYKEFIEITLGAKLYTSLHMYYTGANKEYLGYLLDQYKKYQKMKDETNEQAFK